MNIYIANLPFKASENDVMGLFQEFGAVESARIITDKFTRRSRGFGFVEMNDDSQAQQAIEKLNGSEFMGRNLVVNEAKTRTENA
jgi:RNA recognition motif-containing protein